MAEIGLFSVVYRPEEQLKRLAGGPGPSEMIVSREILTEARKRVMDLPTRISGIHNFFGKNKGEIEKELMVLHEGAIIVVPTVDNLLMEPLESYRNHGWPGLSLQANEYSSLVKVARFLGDLPLPPEDTKHLRDEFFPRRVV